MLPSVLHVLARSGCTSPRLYHGSWGYHTRIHTNHATCNLTTQTHHDNIIFRFPCRLVIVFFGEGVGEGMHFRLLGSLSRRPFTTHSETRLEVGWSLCSMVGKWNALAACSFLSNGKRQRLFFPVSNYTSSFSLLGLVDASPYFFLHPPSPFVFSSFLSPRALVFSLTPSSLIPRFSYFSHSWNYYLHRYLPLI